jgi:hypothetical protein
MIDGYSGDIGFDTFKVVVSNDVSNVSVYMNNMTNPQTVNMGASFTADTTACKSYSWNWGDGTVDTGTVPAFILGSNVTLTGDHTYQEAGEYPVTLMLYDSNGNVIGAQSYNEYYDPGMYQHYIGVKGVTPITVGQQDNLVFVRSSFSDTSDPDLYTASIDWGDGTSTPSGMYGYANRLIYNNSSGYVFTGALSGKANGVHVYSQPGQYNVTMTIYKNGTIFGIVQTPVQVTKVDTYTANTVYTGSLGPGPYTGVYYVMNWGDNTTSTPVVYTGGNFTTTHTYGVGGLFLANISFWAEASPGTINPSADHMITSWSYPTISCVQQGMNVFVNGAEIVNNGVAFGSHAASIADEFNVSADIPTNLPSTQEVQVIYHWGDMDTGSVVYPDANGVIHLNESHVYSAFGLYTPSIEVLEDMNYRIGVATSDTLDVGVQAGIINGPTGTVSDSGTFTLNTTIPGMTGQYGKDWNTRWTLLDSSGNPVTESAPTQQLPGGVIQVTINCASNHLTSGEKYGVELDILDSNGNIVSSEVYYYVQA